MINVVIGYDPREAIAYHVLAHSIWQRSSLPVSITPLRLESLPMWRVRDPLQSTDFAFSRFLTPYLAGYEGHSIFMDCDMLCLDDIAKLWDLRSDQYAVQVVKHDHKPTEHTKFLGAYQTAYARKNWSSVMLFNNSKCKKLDPAYVNSATGLDLHQFKWLDDSQIGEIPQEWNYLVGHSKGKASLVHYTIGGPYFPEYEACEYSAEWFAERDMLTGQSDPASKRIARFVR